MNRLHVPEPISAGLILSYKCNCQCKHCMYACSPSWKANWISEDKIERILAQLSAKILSSPFGPDKIGVNYGLHFTGGEPFLNFDLLVKTIKIANDFGIPSTFVETNCFWCINDEIVRKKLTQLKNEGLHGILISVNPFVLEQVPFERTMRAIKISEEIFDGNVIVYQDFFRHQFEEFNIKGTMSFMKYLQMAGPRSLSYIELLPMGRACYKLGFLYGKYPVKTFFGESCKEELTRPWHVHIDNYGNYVSGYCGGISLGDAEDMNSLRCINLEEKPILKALATDIKSLYDIGVKEFNYQENNEGYISKCHLCIDIRKHIVQKTSKFRELNPTEFYQQLNA